MTLDGRVAMVTGAGSGLGRAAARRLAAAGARIGAVGLDREGLDQTVAMIREAGGEALAIEADIAEVDAIEGAVVRIVEEWGRLDLLFANAGINGVWAPLDQLAPEEWDETIRVNLRGTFLTVRSALPHLKERGGAIVITSSVNGTRIFSNSGATAYSTTKAGLVAFAKMIALELAKHRIRVNVICPGWIETEIDQSTEKRSVDEAGEPVEYPEGAVPLTDGAPGDPEQVADLVQFLLSDAASHITGTEVWIDGGESLLEG